MTDEMRKYEKAITEIAGVDDIGDVSDGFHTFNQLYHQRAMLFACIVNQNSDIAWKTRKHEDGEPCFGGGWFLVTIDTPQGAYGYHYEDKYWNYFNCKELDKAKHWDGYTERDVHRLFSLGGELAGLKEEIEYCSGDIIEMIAKAEAEERKCFNDVDISYNQGYIEGLREGEKYINRIKFKKEIQAELDKFLNGNIVGIEVIDGLPE